VGRDRLPTAVSEKREKNDAENRPRDSTETMVEITAEQQPYLADFKNLESRWSKNGGAWALDIRRRAISRFNELGFPTTRHEEWKYTNVSPVKKTPFKMSTSASLENAPSSDQIGRFDLGEFRCATAVFIDGYFSDDLSSLGELPSAVKVCSTHEAFESGDGTLQKNLGKHASFEDHTFVALNTAFMQDGLVIDVPAGTVVETPIRLLFLSTGSDDPLMSHPRNLVTVGENAQVCVVEDFAALNDTGDQLYFNNSVTEICVARHANVNHYKLERESLGAFHIASMAVHQEEQSVFTSHNISFGGRLVRNDIVAHLDGEHIESTLNGLVIGTGDQHIDNHTRILHAKPHCNSWEVYKGIFCNKAHGVFNGKIYVAQDAQKTDAKQTNQTLLLSDTASINAKPELEIYADDVRCTHGATIGQLDTDALFYLRTRGINRETALHLLVYAFASDVLTSIRQDTLRATIQKMLFSKLPQEEQRALGEIA
jgi:Fe-S cluster assembly protein SufD